MYMDIYGNRYMAKKVVALREEVTFETLDNEGKRKSLIDMWF